MGLFNRHKHQWKIIDVTYLTQLNFRYGKDYSYPVTMIIQQCQDSSCNALEQDEFDGKFDKEQIMKNQRFDIVKEP